jgi:hypothetical protein
MLDIHRIVLVGSVTAFGAAWLEAVQASMRERAFPPLAAAMAVEIGQLGEEAVVLGASALLLTHELGVFVPARPGKLTTATTVNRSKERKAT